jgi:hypothetical protein
LPFPISGTVKPRLFTTWLIFAINPGSRPGRRRLRAAQDGSRLSRLRLEGGRATGPGGNFSAIDPRSASRDRISY